MGSNRKRSYGNGPPYTNPERKVYYIVRFPLGANLAMKGGNPTI
jgi:hypothetical protein